MKKLLQTAAGIALGAGLVGASLVAAAPASAAKPTPPPAPVCYETAWTIENRILIDPGTPTVADDYVEIGEYVVSPGSFVEAEQGGVYLSSSSSWTGGNIFGTQAVNYDAPFSEAVSDEPQTYFTPNYVDHTYQYPSPLGQIGVDLDNNGDAETTLTFDTFDTWAGISAANPEARIKSVGFVLSGFSEGWLSHSTVGENIFPWFYFVKGYWGKDAIYEWVPAGTGHGKTVPANTADIRYTVTGQVEVACPYTPPTKPGKGNK
jgi:hypothetical protein